MMFLAFGLCERHTVKLTERSLPLYGRGKVKSRSVTKDYNNQEFRITSFFPPVKGPFLVVQRSPLHRRRVRLAEKTPASCFLAGRFRLRLCRCRGGPGREPRCFSPLAGRRRRGGTSADHLQP